MRVATIFQREAEKASTRRVSSALSGQGQSKPVVWTEFWMDITERPRPGLKVCVTYYAHTARAPVAGM